MADSDELAFLRGLESLVQTARRSDPVTAQNLLVTAKVKINNRITQLLESPESSRSRRKEVAIDGNQ